MSKKFSFNFKLPNFLEKFKKKPNPQIADAHEQNDELDEEEIDPSQFQTLSRENLKAFESAPKTDKVEFETADKAEEFAEKTLNNIKIAELHDSGEHLNQNESKNDNHFFEKQEIPKNTIDHHVENAQVHHTNSEHEHSTNEHIDKTPVEKTEDIELKEMQPPKKPEVAEKPKFNFPKFGSDRFSNLRTGKLNLKSPIQKFEKLNWNEIVLKIFSPYSRSKIHNAFLVILVVCLTYLFGKSIAMIFNRTSKIEITAKTTITLPNDKNESISGDIGKITSTNLFNAKETEESKSKKSKLNIAEIVCLDAEKPTTMQAKLLDTIVLQDSVKSVASVQMRGMGELMDIREGEKLDNMAEVSKITRMKIILKNLETGDCEYLASNEQDDMNSLTSPIKVISASAGKSLFQSMNPNIKNEGNNFKIKKTYRDQMVSKMSEILTQAKAIQITNPDGSLCFKMTEIVPGSLYTQLNIQENDIICNVDGRKIENLNELMGKLGRIKEIDSMQIGVKRSGVTENLDYNFE